AANMIGDQRRAPVSHVFDDFDQVAEPDSLTDVSVPGVVLRTHRDSDETGWILHVRPEEVGSNGADSSFYLLHRRRLRSMVPAIDDFLRQCAYARLILGTKLDCHVEPNGVLQV